MISTQRKKAEDFHRHRRADLLQLRSAFLEIHVCWPRLLHLFLHSTQKQDIHRVAGSSRSCGILLLVQPGSDNNNSAQTLGHYEPTSRHHISPSRKSNPNAFGWLSPALPACQGFRTIGANCPHRFPLTFASAIGDCPGSEFKLALRLALPSIPASAISIPSTRLPKFHHQWREERRDKVNLGEGGNRRCIKKTRRELDWYRRSEAFNNFKRRLYVWLRCRRRWSTTMGTTILKVGVGRRAAADIPEHDGGDHERCPPFREQQRPGWQKWREHTPIWKCKGCDVAPCGELWLFVGGYQCCAALPKNGDHLGVFIDKARMMIRQRSDMRLDQGFLNWKTSQLSNIDDDHASVAGIIPRWAAWV